MQNEELIQANEFCIHQSIEFSFIHSLHEYGLIEVTTIENTEFIHPDQLGELEKLIRLHYDLNINLEGIDAITHLLARVKNMQDELSMLRNRLRIYEINR